MMMRQKGMSTGGGDLLPVVGSILVFASLLQGCCLEDVTDSAARYCGHSTDLPVVKAVDVEKYSGVWYKVWMSSFIYDVDQHGLSCIRVNTPAPFKIDGQWAYNITEWSRKNNGTEKHVETAQILQVEGGEMTLKQPNIPWKVPYDIIDLGTEDDGGSNNYTVSMVSTCAARAGTIGIPGVWIMARGYDLPSNVSIDDLKKKLEAAGFNVKALDLLRVPQGSYCGW